MLVLIGPILLAILSVPDDCLIEVGHSPGQQAGTRISSVVVVGQECDDEHDHQESKTEYRTPHTGRGHCYWRCCFGRPVRMRM